MRLFVFITTLLFVPMPKQKCLQPSTIICKNRSYRLMTVAPSFVLEVKLDPVCQAFIFLNGVYNILYFLLIVQVSVFWQVTKIFATFFVLTSY